MAKPGVMIYFDIRPCLKRLSMEEKALLFEAILDYGECGSEPDFEGAVGVAWDFIKPGIDRDSVRYGKQVLQKQYATYVREVKKNELVPLSFDDWKAVPDNERCRLISADNERYPTTTSTPSTTPTTATSATIESKADKSPTRPKPARKSFGEFGWIKLTDDEYNRLLNDFGEAEVKRCIAYVDESAQSTGNKNRWKDWNLIVRKCHNQGWGLNLRQQQRNTGSSESGIDRLARMYKEEFGE